MASLAYFLSVWLRHHASIKKVSYLLTMSRDVSAGEAAQLLGTSKPTVVALIAKSHLQATKEPRGKLSIWRIDEGSVQRWLAEHGRYDTQDRQGRSRLARLEAQVSALREEVRSLSHTDKSAGDANLMSATEHERDDLRARVVSLEEALVRARIVAELQRDADAERAAVVGGLLEAAAASERADALRRRALREQEEGLAAQTRPGNAAGIA